MNHFPEIRCLLAAPPSLRSWWRLVEIMEENPALETYVMNHVEGDHEWYSFRYKKPTWTDEQFLGIKNSISLRVFDIQTMFKMRYCPPGECLLGEEGVNPLREYKNDSGFWMSTTPITYNDLRFLGLFGVGLDMLDIMACVSSVTPYMAMALCNLFSEKRGIEPYYILDRDFVEAVRTGIEPTWGWQYRARCLELEKNKETNDGYRLPTEDEWEYAARCGFRQEEPHSIAFREDLENFQPTYMENNAWGFSDMVYGGFEMTGTWDNPGYLKMKGAHADYYKAGYHFSDLANNFGNFFRVVRTQLKT